MKDVLRCIIVLCEILYSYGCLVGRHHKLSGLSKRLRVITLLRPDSLWCLPLISPVLLWQYQFCCHGTSKQMIRFEFVVYQYAVSKLSPLLNVQEGEVTVVTLHMKETSWTVFLHVTCSQPMKPFFLKDNTYY